MSVTKDQANSHANIGWEKLTNLIIRKLSSEKENLVFVLWGNHAIKMKSFIDENKHLVLTSVHPSPLSAHRGFLDNQHFSKINNYLQDKG